MLSRYPDKLKLYYYIFTNYPIYYRIEAVK